MASLKQFLIAILITAGALLAIYPFHFMSAGLALLMGLGVSFLLDDTTQDKTMKLAKHVLAISIVCLGAKIDFGQLLNMSGYNLMITAVSILLILLLGLGLTKIFKLPIKTGLLIGVGTAICGGSAIAATAPVIMAEKEDIGLSMAVVFILNAIALFLFPFVGEMIGLDSKAFGYWAALAIHDTSSVVGAALDYDLLALEYATILKLTRALWIGPMVVLLAIIWPYLSQKEDEQTGHKKIKLPWFIVGFVLVSILFSNVELSSIQTGVEMAGVQGLVFALFLIGLSIKFAALKKAGLKSMAMGTTLWGVVSGISLLLIYQGWL